MKNPLSLAHLPIDDETPKILASLSQHDTNRIILEAPPGAGKTTRVPIALLNEAWCTSQVLVSEPRRIAARLAATRVAQETKTILGQLVGYRLRFADETSENTRLIYLTEGLLLRTLLKNPLLHGVSAVVLDEVHERSADLDVLLALLRRTQKLRPDLKVIAMSATLDAAALGSYFEPCVRHRSQGRTFAVDIEYLARLDERPLAIQVRSAIKSSLKREGDILVFLPGSGEIRACAQALEGIPNAEVLPLHGDLSVTEQAHAIAPGGKKKRIILSTNVAESSVTISGVTTVIDSGLARTQVFDPWSGVSRLETIEISQARTVQRAGRAGRVQAGRALRLYTRANYQSRPPQDIPELLRSDLSSIYLSLLFAKVEPCSLEYISPPAQKSWELARELLQQLGALRENTLTDIGRAMAQLPLPVRLARVAIESWRLEIAPLGTLAAVLLSERDIKSNTRAFRAKDLDITTSNSDIEDRIELFEQLKEGHFNGRLARDLNLDIRGARQVDQLQRSILKFLRKACKGLTPTSPPEHPLSAALLAGFVDRVAARRETSRELILSTGTRATLHETSAVMAAPLMLALTADAPFGKRRMAQVRIAHCIEADWLLDVAATEVKAEERHQWNGAKERVDEVSSLTYGKIVLDETRGTASPSEACAKVLAQVALAKGPAIYDPLSRLESLFVRLSLLRTHLPEIFKEDALLPGEEALNWKEANEAENEERFISKAIDQAAQSRSHLAAIIEADLASELQSALPEAIQGALRREVPVEVTLRGGKRVQVHFDKGRPPWIESRLQDFFSMSETPHLCRGRLALQLHLLAPNKRALQVTTDLAGFWERHYPDLRRQLQRRYPRHLWPEDGCNAEPPPPGRIRYK